MHPLLVLSSTECSMHTRPSTTGITRTRGSARREPATAPPARHRHDTPGTCDRYSTPYSRRGMDAWCRVRGGGCSVQLLHGVFDVWSILHISGQPRGDILLRMYYESTVMTLRDKTPLAALELKISTVHAAGKRRVRRATARVQGTPSTRQCVGWRLLFDRGHALHIIRQTCHPCRPRPSPCEANRGSSLPQTLRARLRPARHLPRMAARRRMRH